MDEQHDKQDGEQEEETIRDLDVPEEDADDVTGGGFDFGGRPDKA